jgi:DNA invertase Pin-like site-specific DNA recombinase
MTQKARFVSYLRVSTDKQGQSGLGLEAQRAAVQAHIRGAGGRLLKEFVEVESGKKADRPKLVEALRHAKITGATLVIAKIDRLSRNLAFLANLMESGVDFVAADNPHATRLTIHILAAIAEHEAKAISDRTKAALAAAKARGVKLGNPNGAAPLRGQGNGAAVTAVREGADRRAKELLPVIEAIKAEGHETLWAIAKELNERGIMTARGRRWHASTVRDVLRRAAA